MIDASTTRWLRRLTPTVPTDRQVTLICLPHAGGSAGFYTPLARALAGRVDVLAVQYPGRQDRIQEPCVPSVAGLVEEILAVGVGRDEAPYALFGHSMGAIVGYELALRLEAEAHPPLRLFVSARRAPLTWRDEQVHLEDDEGLIDELVRLGSTDGDLLREPEIRELVLPMVRSDYRAIETYRCVAGKPLACPITVLTGDQDPCVSWPEASRWREQAGGEFALEVFPGGHFFPTHQFERVADTVAAALTTAPMRGERP